MTAMGADQTLKDQTGGGDRQPKEGKTLNGLSWVSSARACVSIYNGDVCAIDDLALLTYATPRTSDDALKIPPRAAGIPVIPVGDARGTAGNAVRNREWTRVHPRLRGGRLCGMHHMSLRRGLRSFASR
jgi:hypothetical protein